MSLLSRKVALPAVALLCLAACHQEASPTTETRPATLQVEEAARGAELGRDLVKSRAALDALRQDPTVSGVDREDATLALSSAGWWTWLAMVRL